MKSNGEISPEARAAITNAIFNLRVMRRKIFEEEILQRPKGEKHWNEEDEKREKQMLEEVYNIGAQFNVSRPKVDSLRNELRNHVDEGQAHVAEVPKAKARKRR